MRKAGLRMGQSGQLPQLQAICVFQLFFANLIENLFGFIQY